MKKSACVLGVFFDSAVSCAYVSRQRPILGNKISLELI